MCPVTTVHNPYMSQSALVFCAVTTQLEKEMRWSEKKRDRDRDRDRRHRFGDVRKIGIFGDIRSFRRDALDLG